MCMVVESESQETKVGVPFQKFAPGGGGKLHSQLRAAEIEQNSRLYSVPRLAARISLDSPKRTTVSYG